MTDPAIAQVARKRMPIFRQGHIGWRFREPDNWWRPINRVVFACPDQLHLDINYAKIVMLGWSRGGVDDNQIAEVKNRIRRGSRMCFILEDL